MKATQKSSYNNEYECHLNGVWCSIMYATGRKMSIFRFLLPTKYLKTISDKILVNTSKLFCIHLALKNLLFMSALLPIFFVTIFKSFIHKTHILQLKLVGHWIKNPERNCIYYVTQDLFLDINRIIIRQGNYIVRNSH